MGEGRTCERCGMPVDDDPCPCEAMRICPFCGEAFDPAADPCLAAALDRCAVLEKKEAGMRAIIKEADKVQNAALQMTVTVPGKMSEQVSRVLAAVEDYQEAARAFVREMFTDGGAR